MQQPDNDSYFRKRPTRRQMQEFTKPVKEALKQMRSGEVDTIRGYPVFKDWTGEWSRIDWAMNGFVSMVRRAAPQIVLAVFEKLAAKLENGVMLTIPEIDLALGRLKEVDKALSKVTRGRLKECVLIEQIDIELAASGLKGA